MRGSAVDRSTVGVKTMDGVSVFVLDANRLFREALKQLLAGTRYRIEAEAGSLAEARAMLEGSLPPSLLLFDPDGEHSPFDVMRQLRSLAPDTRLVVLTTRLSSVALAQSLQAGADGYLLKDMSLAALTQSLDLAMVGEKVFSTQLAHLLTRASQRAVRSMPDMADRPDGLSNRETAILRCLVHGYTNRAIADELRLTEASVKVHLKGVLRKIQATNRTQAAIWALNHGFELDGAASSKLLVSSTP